MSLRGLIKAVLLAALVGFGIQAMAQSAENEAPIPWLLTKPDLSDARALAVKLRDARDPVSAYLRGKFEATTIQMLDEYSDRTEPPPQLIQALVTDLNTIITSATIYEANRFAGVVLSQAIRDFLKGDQTGVSLAQFNRRLLEDVYSNEIETAWRLPCFLRARDVLDARSLAVKLRDARDPVSAYLREHLPPETRAQLADYSDISPPARNLLAALICGLNVSMQGENIFDRDRFAAVYLSKPTKQLLERDPQGDERTLLNRLLLEDAYPAELSKIDPIPIDVRADSLEYEHDKNLLIGAGKVFIRKGNELLRSDHAIINMQSYDVLAEGNVTFERDNDVWVGKTLRYNFKTQKGDFGGFRAYLDPFYITAKSSRRIGSDQYLLEDAVLTTCESDRPEAYFRAKKVLIRPGRHVRAQHVVLYVKGMPVMYSPFWNQNIGDKNFISLVPGYNSRMYLFLLTAFNYRINRNVEAATHLDARMRRGLGVGQDIMWSSSGNAKGLSTERQSGAPADDFWYFGQPTWKSKEADIEEDKWHGDLITYYTHDDWPDEGDKTTYPIDKERYRLRLYHNQEIDDKNYMLMQLNYLSDYKIIEHFFRDEFKSSPEPENYLIFGHRAERFTINLMLQKRLNDFFTALDRIPEASIDFSRKPIGDSPFYYQGKTAAAYLQQQWESKSANSNLVNYAAGRFDTDHTIYYPTKQFGFLNIIPRAGWRGTYYSKTKEDYTNITYSTRLDTNKQPVITSTTNVLARELNAQMRSVYKLGLETSFKAFKVWETYPGDIINNIRHIAEPYADYSWTPEPNVLTNNLYQFDEVDTLTKMNEVRLGMRNKIQTQRFRAARDKRSTIYDLINADLWINYRLDPDPNQNTFSNLCYDVRSTPFDWLELKMDGAFNTYESEFQKFNTRLSIKDRKYWNYMVEHRVDKDRSNLLSNELSFSPTISWKYNIYLRYEFETSTAEAWGLTIQRTKECIAYKVGYEQKEDDEFTVWLQFWFTKFPKARVDVGL